MTKRMAKGQKKRCIRSHFQTTLTNKIKRDKKRLVNFLHDWPFVIVPALSAATSSGSFRATAATALLMQLRVNWVDDGFQVLPRRFEFFRFRQLISVQPFETFVAFRLDFLLIFRAFFPPPPVPPAPASRQRRRIRVRSSPPLFRAACRPRRRISRLLRPSCRSPPWTVFPCRW